MHEVSRPLASAGVDGTTTFRPGTWASHASSDCEWVAPELSPPKTAVRRVSGAPSSPPDMNRALAAWLTSWSSPMLTKSMIISSATGRSPARAVPTAAPTMAASEIGVSRTRSVPKVVDSPLVTWEIPPAGSARSSPSRTTSGSAASASASAALRAPRMVSSTVGGPSGVGPLTGAPRCRPRRRR